MTQHDAEHDAQHDARHDAGAARGAPRASCSPAKPGEHDASTAHRRRAAGAHDAAHDAEHDAPIDAARVTARLEEAGRTLLSLPGRGPSPRLRMTVWEVLRAPIEGYGWDGARLRPPRPEAARISRMDEALGWIALIPRDRYVLRRIVGARALVHPLTDRHLFPWRRLGAALGADHKAVQRWHAQGIALIVAGLNRGG
jgi:hypothetical protein